MLQSGVLELLEHILKENRKMLILYIANVFRDQLKRFEHLGTIKALNIKYEQSLENGDTNMTINVADSRKRIDERALEKEEEDYFNEDSDEEDSASARSSSARNPSTSTALADETNVASSLGSGAVGLVDYDDDEDDEDYNPPPRSEPPTDDDDMTADLCRSKHKFASVGESKDVGFMVTKKRRLNQHSREVKPVEVKLSGKASVHELPPSADFCSLGSNVKVDDIERKSTPERSNIIQCTSDTRKTALEDNTSAPISSSSSEMTVNNANVSSSEPYSVR